MGQIVSPKVIIASVGVVGVSAYVLTHQKNIKKPELEEYLNNTDKSPSIVEKAFSTDIDIKYTNDNCLETQTIMEIYTNQLELATDDFIRLSLTNRITRRKLRKQGKLQQYVDQVVLFIMDIEEVLELSLKKLLYELDIPKEIFEESVLIQMDQGYFQQLYLLQASVKQKIKEKIPTSKHLNIKQLKEIIKYHTYILKNFPKEMHDILLKIPTEHTMLVPTIINIFIADIIYAKYSIEEEDQIKNLKMINQDQEILDLLHKVEIEMSELLKSQGIRLNDIPESLENFT